MSSLVLIGTMKTNTKTEHLSLRIEAKLLARLRKAAESTHGPTQSKLIHRGIELSLDEFERLQSDGREAKKR